MTDTVILAKCGNADVVCKALPASGLVNALSRMGDHTFCQVLSCSIRILYILVSHAQALKGVAVNPEFARACPDCPGCAICEKL